MTFFLGKRTKALLEVCLVTLSITFMGWLFEAYLTWLPLWGWLFKAFTALVTLLIIALPRRSLSAYGFLPRKFSFTLRWSAIILAIFTVPAALSIIVSMALGVAKPAKLTPVGVALNAIFFMVFVGLVEEAMFRGYVQSRLNEAFGRRWRRLIFRAWRVNYGVGLLITSIIFAAVHIVNYWNPLTHRWEPVWWMPIHLVGCFAFGCVAGALREASCDVYVPASLHGGVMTAYTFLLTYTSELALNVSLFISWFTFFYLLAYLFISSESLTSEA